MELRDYGWTAAWAATFETGRGLEPARVTEEQKGLYRVCSARGEVAARLAGRFRHVAEDHEIYPVVGDWVVLGQGGVIRDVLPRRTVLRRRRGFGATAVQVLAANLDAVFIVTSLNRDFNPRRIERYLTLVWESGAQPVVVLSKSDLCADTERYSAETESLCIGVPVLAVCALTGAGIDALAEHLSPGKTIALVGSSGVGKSTLINTLAGEELQVVKQIRKDAYRGLHTTTSRQMVRLGQGALLIDTPGMRELALWDAEDGVAGTFSDIEELASTCRFRDCAHKREPGCAVQAALSEGALDAERWESYGKLSRELKRLEIRQAQRTRIEARRQNRRVQR